MLATRCDVRVERLPPLDVLEARWRTLEPHSRASFFLSWTWIGTWLRTLCPVSRARLVTIDEDGRTLALGIVVEQRRARVGAAAHPARRGRALRAQPWALAA